VARGATGRRSVEWEVMRGGWIGKYGTPDPRPSLVSPGVPPSCGGSTCRGHHHRLPHQRAVEHAAAHGGGAGLGGRVPQVGQDVVRLRGAGEVARVCGVGGVRLVLQAMQLCGQVLPAGCRQTSCPGATSSRNVNS